MTYRKTRAFWERERMPFSSLFPGNCLLQPGRDGSAKLYGGGRSKTGVLG